MMEKLVHDILLINAMIRDNKSQMTEVMFNNYCFHMDRILKQLYSFGMSISLSEETFEELASNYYKKEEKGGE